MKPVLAFDIETVVVVEVEEIPLLAFQPEPPSETVGEREANENLEVAAVLWVLLRGTSARPYLDTGWPVSGGLL